MLNLLRDLKMSCCIHFTQGEPVASRFATYRMRAAAGNEARLWIMSHQCRQVCAMRSLTCPIGQQGPSTGRFVQSVYHPAAYAPKTR